MTKRRALVFATLILWPFLFVATGAQAATSSWRYVEKKLVKNGFSRSFINEMKEVYEPRDLHKVVELNVLLFFLRQKNDHGPQVTSKSAIQETREFMDTYEESLKIAEKTYRVPRSVIASLLWIESRHGRNQGRYHVPSVYLSLLQSDRPAMIRHLKKNTKKFAATVTPEQKAKIAERAKTKAEWALVELKAIQKAYRWKWTSVAQLRGSFSGAFGMPQFIPSSYARWARPQGHKGAPDLFKAEDSIQSVAHYLADSGWKQKVKKTHIPALLKYNNSRDYAQAILDLSDEVQGFDEDQPEQRVAL